MGSSKIRKPKYEKKMRPFYFCQGSYRHRYRAPEYKYVYVFF